MIVYQVIKGERAAVELLKRMGLLQKDWVSWCESFAYYGNITLERLYEKSPKDEYYQEYIILYEAKPLGYEPKPGQLYGYWMSDIREEVHKNIRAGKFEEEKNQFLPVKTRSVP